jgi:hypothetical protein
MIGFSRVTGLLGVTDFSTLTVTIGPPTISSSLTISSPLLSWFDHLTQVSLPLYFSQSHGLSLSCLVFLHILVRREQRKNKKDGEGRRKKRMRKGKKKKKK